MAAIRIRALGDGLGEKDWTASFRQCQPSPKLRQSRRTRLAVDGISARLSGVWARSSPEAAKRGVRDAGLEVGHIPRDHRSAVWSFIASDMSDRSSADLYNLVALPGRRPRVSGDGEPGGGVAGCGGRGGEGSEEGKGVQVDWKSADEKPRTS